MLDSISSVAALATQMANQKTAQQVDIAVFKKAQDLQEQQGQAVLQLINDSAVPAQSIDVHV
jgi:hypothetical protein